MNGQRVGKWQGWHPNGEDRYVRYYENGEIEESFEYEMKKVESKLPLLRR